MRMAYRFAMSLALVTASSAVAQAHPGHAHEVVAAESGWHYLVQPEHALITGVGLAVVISIGLMSYARIMVKRSHQQLQPLRVRR